ncbi:MAG TPA: META domain-containing protein [Vicinamibacteria bacterium]|jgi:heat shock protein HslJ
MRILTLVTAALFASSCADTLSAPSVPDGVVGSWELRSLQLAGQPAVTVEPGRYTADFTADGSLTVRADCNRCSGSYSSSGSSLEIDELACTRAYCGDASFSDLYSLGLDGAVSFQRSGASLAIRYGSGSLLFTQVP